MIGHFFSVKSSIEEAIIKFKYSECCRWVTCKFKAFNQQWIGLDDKRFRHFKQVFNGSIYDIHLHMKKKKLGWKAMIELLIDECGHVT